MASTSTYPIEYTGAVSGTCAVCGKPTDGETKCKLCGKVFCFDHAHMLALSHTEGMNIVFACEKCIDDHHLYVIDVNHPFYMKNGGKK